MSKTWLVTGSARGLGLAIVRAALAAGDRVVATARSTEALAELELAFGADIAPLVLDVTDPSAARAAIALAQERFGTLDVLVNNAGFGILAPVEHTEERDFRDQIEVNLFGAVNMIRAALPHFRTRRSGHIINISSVGARVSTPGLGAYQAAKWAVSGLTEVLAKEVGPFGVSAVAVEPGSMRTGWTASASHAVRRLHPDYEPSVGASIAGHAARSGREMSDPAKVADVIVGLSRRIDLPPHLVLGRDALDALAEADVVRTRQALRWLEVSKSVDAAGESCSAEPLPTRGALH